MTRLLPALILALATGLAACTDPTLSTTLSVGSDGVSISPSVSGQVGGATVTVSN